MSARNVSVVFQYLGVAEAERADASVCDTGDRGIRVPPSPLNTDYGGAGVVGLRMEGCEPSGKGSNPLRHPSLLVKSFNNLPGRNPFYFGLGAKPLSYRATITLNGEEEFPDRGRRNRTVNQFH